MLESTSGRAKVLAVFSLIEAVASIKYVASYVQLLVEGSNY